jgi:hypothetical protein
MSKLTGWMLMIEIDGLDVDDTAEVLQTMDCTCNVTVPMHFTCAAHLPA